MNRTLSTIVGFVLLCACVAHAAEIVVRPGENIQAKADAASSGDTVRFAAGDHTHNGVLTLKHGVTYTGEATQKPFLLGTVRGLPIAVMIPVPAAKITFTTANNEFAIRLPADANKITISNLALRANCGLVAAANGNTNDFTFTDNDVQHGYNGTYYNRLAIRATGVQNRMKIERNFFNNSLSSDRTVDLYNMRDSSQSYNIFHKVNDGGHWDGKTINSKFVGNVGSQIRRMGLELQDHNGRGGDNIEVSGNVFFDWYEAYWDSFGLSVMPQFSTNVRITNNYLSANRWNNTLGIKDSSGNHRFGYGIEAGLWSGIVENNTVIGPWVGAVVVSMPNTRLKGNKAYGSQPWGTYITEPGSGPAPASIIDLGNEKNLAMADAPAPTLPGQAPPATQPDVPPIAPTTLAARAFKSMVHVTHTPGAKVEKRAGDNVWRAVMLEDGYDKGFTADQVANKWVWFYRATLNGISSPEVRVQLNLDTNPADPAPMPVPPPPQPIGDLVISGKVNGVIVDVIYQRKADGTFNPQPTTRPVQPQQ
jgi:hypothetical protein